MRHSRTIHWIAALLVFAHALAPGIHALQLRYEQRHEHIVRSCCLAGNVLGGGNRDASEEIGLQHARLLQCSIGTLLLSNHGFVPQAAATSPRAAPRGRPLVVLAHSIERDRRPGTPPARGPPA